MEVIKGVGVRRHCKTRGVGKSTPLIRMVKLPRLNEGGMGCQGQKGVTPICSEGFTVEPLKHDLGGEFSMK